MEHVVFYPAQDGSPAFRRLENLEEAVRLVEHLRNAGGVGEASVHSLTEVPLSFRAYYRVEVPGLTDALPAAPPATETPLEPLAELAPVALAPSPEPFVVDSVDEEQPVPALVPEQPAVEQHEAFELAAVGVGVEDSDGHQAPTGSPFSTDRSLGFFA